MASNKDYLTFILEQLSDLDDISYRAMMGEYILYFRGKIIGGIYDDRLLVKPVQSAICSCPCMRNFLHQRKREPPPKNNNKKPLAMSFTPTAKGFLIWIYLLHNRLSIIL